MSNPYAPLEMPDFREGASVDGEPVATMNDLAELRRFFLDTIGLRIQELVFNNGAIVPGSGSGGVVMPSDLYNQVALHTKSIYHTYLGDAALGTNFPVFTSQAEADDFHFLDSMTSVITNFGTTNQDTSKIRMAGLTSKKIVRRWVLVTVTSTVPTTTTSYNYCETVLNFTLNADKVSYATTLDYSRWLNNPCPSNPLVSGASSDNVNWATDLRQIPTKSPDQHFVGQINLDLVLSDINIALGPQPTITKEQILLPFSMGYYALAVR